jgi:flagellar hook assembly protein FlgD
VVANPKQKIGTSINGYPRYRFSTSGSERRAQTSDEVSAALDEIRVVPNPYYGFSDYENNSTSNIIKITNLPAKCDITIYSIDGKFIRAYKRNEVYSPYKQITEATEWDLKNNKGIPVASGVYLIHVNSPQGERTIKWFGINRKFDPGNF